MIRSIIGVITFVWVLVSCSPAPRHLLTQYEKEADLHWLYSTIAQNYAPLAYKEQNFNFKFDALKDKYIRDSKNTKTNEEFYLLLHKFLAEFHDAHVSGMLVSADLPKRTTLAYLGFDGVRSGNALLVRNILPTTVKLGNFPIQVGDKIVKLDGRTLPDIVQKDLAPYRSLGHSDGELTYHFPKIFNRNSLFQPFPARKNGQPANALITFERKGKLQTESLPWIEKDLFTFTAEQKIAAEANRKEENGEDDDDGDEALARIPSVAGLMREDVFFRLGSDLMMGRKRPRAEFLDRIALAGSPFRFENTFSFMDVSPTWGSDTMVQLLGAATGVKVKPIDALRAARKVPKHAIFLSTTASIPVYITLEAKKDKSGKEIAKKYIAYMYLPSFSGGSDASVTEVKESLKKLEAFGVKDLIIDLIDNGGGALDYGFKLAQALTPNNLVLPEIAFKLSDFWLDQFESRSLKASSDPEREIARRVFDGLQKDIEAGKGPLSRPWSIHDLSPFTFRGNSDLKETPNIVLLVNEHCASMCDIFAATLQDNKMATLIGSDTLGAGGNVVTHRQAPNSHFLVNLTESMVLRRDGTPIENKKVKPTIAMDVAATRFDSYEPVRQRAVDFFLTGK